MRVSCVTCRSQRCIDHGHFVRVRLLVWCLTPARARAHGASNNSDQFGEARFSNAIDVAMPHSDANLRVLFGSTLAAGVPAYWGISAVEIFVHA